MSLTLGVDTYISIEDATAYLSDYGNGQAVSEGDLKRATLAIDRLYGARLTGEKTGNAQPLQFPRDGATTIPTEVGQATAELAALIASGTNPYTQPDPLVIEESVTVDVLTQSRKYASAYSSSPLYSITLTLSRWLQPSGWIRFADVSRG